jgi:hypothetical protein
MKIGVKINAKISAKIGVVIKVSHRVPINMTRVPLVLHATDEVLSTVYTDYMKKAQLHKYTVFQIFVFAMAFMVQNFPTIAIAFPLMRLLSVLGQVFKG